MEIIGLLIGAILTIIGITAMVIVLVIIYNVDDNIDVYRTPTIYEFKQGFEFQRIVYRKGDRLGYFYPEGFGGTKEAILAKEDKWQDVTVWWDRDPRTITNEHNGVTVTYTECPQMEWSPWIDEGYIEGLIKNEDVRVKRG